MHLLDVYLFDKKEPSLAFLERPRYIETQPTLSNAYAIALNELQELESEPLCHRTAARLLVDNCHLLAGEDEATVSTDSRRIARDFVDAYAASLAICDLERGAFRIPHSCSKFRESALSKMPARSKPDLHVSTQEIDKCLEGLAQSDSSWNTWVSYRHKAVRFCDAARADNEKDENIRLYQRVTKILEKLTTEIETHIQNQTDGMETAFERTRSKVYDLEPHLDAMTRGLEHVEDQYSKLHDMAELSQEVMDRASVEAQNLQHILHAMVQHLQQKAGQLSTTYETAVGDVVTRASYEAQSIMVMLASAAASSASLQDEMSHSSQSCATLLSLSFLNHLQLRLTTKRKYNADTLQRMKLIETYASSISTRYEEHGEALALARHKTDQILGSLDYAAESAASFHKSLSASFTFRGWLPYIYCPLISLVMGSYGLNPSLPRNIVLAGVGEVVGFVISHLDTTWAGPYKMDEMGTATTVNTTGWGG
ncbi:Nuclear membrane fusion protein Kar5 [Geosmithia morbida]|uniref:Nuclear membrane fusion protein Kar5 n=1 Tax=Geosmithia morbida TaxID=1094350 RepID=A0A9P4YW96_9HYPO|nr:Nuclear membrane fusion protein Kar5 [Geosmithia morbida]KAF4122189.1 Nuclear membrane fusion protein Kar5 [Geosmithia morbida]